MSFFKEKGPYWYFVTIEKGKEVQHYLGKEERILHMIEVCKAAIEKSKMQNYCPKGKDRSKTSGKTHRRAGFRGLRKNPDDRKK